jgi:uroporphyrinogen-III synthase
MNPGRPLDGKRIVVTRAIDQARGLKDRLETMGAIVLLLPAVSFSEPSDTTELDRAIGSLDSFDWILFTSANAVRFFSARRRKLASAFPAGKAPLCAAVGPATATAAAAEGFTVDYVAKEFLGAALARELGDSLAGKKVVLPRSERAGRDLPDALKTAGAYVTEVLAYHTGGINAADPAVLQALREARVDVVSFFSPSAVENLRGELGPEVFSRLAEQAALAAVGPVTAASLRKAGLPVSIEASEATADSMATAIQDYFSRNAESQAGTAGI